MAASSVSKLWSCESLNVGIAAVATRSATAIEEELLAELKDQIVGFHVA